MRKTRDRIELLSADKIYIHMDVSGIGELLNAIIVISDGKGMFADKITIMDIWIKDGSSLRFELDMPSIFPYYQANQKYYVGIEGVYGQEVQAKVSMGCVPFILTA